MDEKWYALYTNPRAEKKVSAELFKKGFENYLPLQKTLKQWSDRKKWVETPLFNSYIFIKINLEKSYQTVLNTIGVVKFIKFGSELAILRESQINDIKLLLSNFEGIEVTNTHFSKGQDVEVIAGPLKGHTGQIIEQKGNHYFSIELEQLSAQILIQLPSHYLKNI